MSLFAFLLAVTDAGKEYRWLGLDWNYWVFIGILGNIVFGSRFIVQWVASEKAGDSVIPRSFWYLSIVGSSLLSIYFILQREPVGIFANLPNSCIYIRNLVLIKKKQQRDLATATAAAATTPVPVEK